MYTHTPSEEHLARLAKITDLPIVVPTSESEARQACRESVAFLGHRYLRQCLETRPSELRWIQLLGGGVDHIGVDFGRLPYVVTRTTFASGVIAWHAFALLLSLVRGLHDQAAPLLPLPRKAMIIGYGEIGAALGQRLQRNGIEVHGVRRSAGAPRRVATAFTRGTGRTISRRWMRFSSALPLNDATEGFFGADCLARLKATAVLVVVGRARTVDLVALPEMLPRIGGVAFDAPDSPNLEACPNVLISPWNAGRYPERAADTEQFMEAQLARFVAGERLENVVRFN